MHPADLGHLLPLAFLAPDIVKAILAGRQPAVKQQDTAIQAHLGHLEAFRQVGHRLDPAFFGYFEIALQPLVDAIDGAAQMQPQDLVRA